MIKWFWLGVNPLIPLKDPNVSIFGCSFQLLINCPGTQFGCYFKCEMTRWGKQQRSLLQKIQVWIFFISFPICRIWDAPSSWWGRELVWGRLTSAFPALVASVGKLCSVQSRANLPGLWWAGNPNSHLAKLLVISITLSVSAGAVRKQSYFRQLWLC